jgi:hypothetical protein
MATAYLMSIKGEQQACLTALHFRLQALESAFGYEERPLDRAVMSPKSLTPCPRRSGLPTSYIPLRSDDINLK